LSDHLTIRIPATTRHVALVRATATTLAALLDFTYDRLTDLHIAIDEVCSRILATSSPHASRLEVTFTLEESGITVDARGDSPLKPGEEFLTTWSKAILDSVAERMEVGITDGVTVATFRVPKG
jgi:histidine kinase-like protein